MTHGFPCGWAVVASTITLGEVPARFMVVCIVCIEIMVIVVGFLSTRLL